MIHTKLSPPQIADGPKRKGFDQSARSAFDQGCSLHRPYRKPPDAWAGTKWRPKPLRITLPDAPRETCACETCGTVFVPKRVDTKTCSPACRQRAYRLRKVVA